MKRTFILQIITILLCTSSCIESINYSDQQEREEIEYILKAGFDITKVALNSDGTTPNWEDGDKIIVLDENKNPVGNKGGIFTLCSGTGTTSGTFSGSVTVGQTPVYAIYPAEAAIVTTGSAINSGNLPWNIGEGEYAGIKDAIMLGKSDDGENFTFINACTILKINTGDYGNVGEAAIKSITIDAYFYSYEGYNRPSPVAGLVDINWNTLKISAFSSGTESEVQLQLPSHLQKGDKDIYIPILPQSAETSVKFTFTNIDEKSGEIYYFFDSASEAGTINDLGRAEGIEFKQKPYVIIKALYDGTNESDLKWCRQNLAVTPSGYKSWKGTNSKAVKVPGTDESVIVGDYFSWASKWTRYSSFKNTQCGDTSDSFTGDSKCSFEFVNTDYNNKSTWSYSNYNSSTKEILELSDDAARRVLSETWRIPTKKEFQALKDATYWNWDDLDKGYYVYAANPQEDAGKVNDGAGTYNKTNALLFFPATGYGEYTSLIESGTIGHYWSSNVYLNYFSSAHDLWISKDEGVDPQAYSGRHQGYSIRAVSE